jgi:hypothetical protein
MKNKFKVEDFAGKKVTLLCVSEEERKGFLKFLKKNYSKEISDSSFERSWGTMSWGDDPDTYDCFFIDKNKHFHLSTFKFLNDQGFKFVYFDAFDFSIPLEEMTISELEKAGYKKVIIKFAKIITNIDPTTPKAVVGIVPANYGKNITKDHYQFIQINVDGNAFFQNVNTIESIKDIVDE